MQFVFAKPPSLNHIYGYTSRGGFARSYMTKKGRDWFEQAITQIEKKVKSENLPTHIEPKNGVLRVEIDFYTRREQDIDNILKPTLDLMSGVCLECHTKHSARKLCDCGKNNSVIVNDKLITELEIKKTKIHSPEEERIVFTIVN